MPQLFSTYCESSQTPLMLSPPTSDPAMRRGGRVVECGGLENR